MANAWYYAKDDRQAGPVTIEALIDMIREGHVRPATLVWTESMTEWQPAATVAELMPARQIAGQAAGGAHVGVADPSLNYFSAVSPYGNVVYAGFWMRFAAAIIDGIILTIAANILQFIVSLGVGVPFIPGAGGYSLGRPSPVFGLFSGEIVMYWLYFALMESSKIQATVGKLALGIIVTDLQGQRIGFGKATGRFFAKYISCLTLWIGFMMAGWTHYKQALHDMMAGCLVIRKA